MIVSPKTVQITPGIHWVGVEDWQSRIFDSLITLPYGTSYNAYLVSGTEKTALIDSVKPGFEGQWLAKVASVTAPERVDYVVMNHAEPDHAGAIPAIMNAAPEARLVATKKGVEMARVFFDVPAERTLEVKSGDSIDLGGKRLEFIEAPWLHWPETMFTFAAGDAVLFPCDFFGAHIAADKLFADEVGGVVVPEAKRYYAEIMMPFRTLVEKGLDKALAVKPRMIAPSHGPVHREPQVILDAYERWARGPLACKAVVLYASMWGSTRKLAEVVTAAISKEGVETVPYELTVADISHVARDLVDASALVIGSPTFLAGPHPSVAYALTLVRALKPRVKLAAFFGSCGWGGGAMAQVKNQVEPLGFTLVDAFEIKGPPRDADLQRAAALGEEIARRVLG